MGIRGDVRCVCYEKGLAAPPPVPVRIEVRDQLRPIDGAAHNAVRDWMRTSCIHPDMAEAELGLSWLHTRSFYDRLESVGEDVFPVLLANVPQWNGPWWMTPDEAARALDELRRFDADHSPEAMHRLTDSTDPGRYYQVAHGSTEWFFTARLVDGTQATAGLGDGRFCLWPHADFAAPVFEATAVEQRPVGDELVELSDPVTGRSTRIRERLAAG